MRKKQSVEQIIDQIEEQAPTNGSLPPEPESGQEPRRFFKVAPVQIPQLTVNVMDEQGNITGTVPFNPVTVVYPHGANLDLIIRTAEAQAPSEWEKKQRA